MATSVSISIVLWRQMQKTAVRVQVNATVDKHITGSALYSKGSAIGMNEAEVVLNSSLAVINIPTSGEDIMVEENEAYTSLKVKEPVIQQNEAYGVHARDSITASLNEAYGVHTHDSITTSQNEAYGVHTRDLLMESPNGAYEV